MTVSKQCYELIKEILNKKFNEEKPDWNNELYNMSIKVDDTIKEIKLVPEWAEDESFVFCDVMEYALRIWNLSNSQLPKKQCSLNTFLSCIFDYSKIAFSPYTIQQTKNWTIAHYVAHLKTQINKYVQIAHEYFNNTDNKNHEIKHDIALIKIISYCCYYLSKDEAKIPTALAIKNKNFIENCNPFF